MDAFKMTGVVGIKQRKAAKKLPVWLGRLRISSAYQVTHVLLDQMHAAESLIATCASRHKPALLEALVEEELAMDLASYSVAVVEGRLR